MGLGLLKIQPGHYSLKVFAFKENATIHLFVKNCFQSRHLERTTHLTDKTSVCFKLKQSHALSICDSINFFPSQNWSWLPFFPLKYLAKELFTLFKLWQCKLQTLFTLKVNMLKMYIRMQVTVLSLQWYRRRINYW